jgi:hypothetical protein
MSGMKIAVPVEIYERVQAIATAEGTTVEELVTKALSFAVCWNGSAQMRMS